MSEELFKRVGSRLPGAKAPPAFAGDAYDWLGGFVGSSIASMGELVGIKPSTTMQEWRVANPLASFLSEVGGMAVPYAGWFTATKKLKAFDKAVTSLGDLNKLPFLTGAVREAARFAPFEAGRVAVSQVVGDEDLGSMAGQAAVNLAIGAGLGGTLSAIASAGTRAFPLAKLAPGIDIAAPVQIQSRYLKELLSKNTLLPENAAQVEYRLKELRDFARAEILPAGQRHIGELEGTDPNVSKNINRLFRTSDEKSGFHRRRFVHSRSSKLDFPSNPAWQQAATQAGLPKNFEDLGQYFRHVSFSPNTGGIRAAGATNKFLTGDLESLGNGWFMKREADDGLFVMARKVKGEVEKGTPDDQWIIFKTDSPGEFVPLRQKWANAIIGKNAWMPQAGVSKDGGPVYNMGTSFMEKFGFTNYRVLNQDPQGMAAAIDKLMPKKFKGKQNELVERMKDAVKEYFAPARMQFAKSPRANWIHSVARAMYDAAETEAQTILYGSVKLDPSKSVFRSAMRGQQTPDNAQGAALKTLVDSLSDKEVEEVHALWRARMGAQEDVAEDLIMSGKVSLKAAEVANKLDEVDLKQWEELNKLQSAVGMTVTKAQAGHMGISHQWLGDTRIALRGEDGNVVAIASGFNRKHAQARAKELQEILQKEGTSARIAEEFELSQVDAVPKDLRPVLRAPGFVLERQGIRGFRWDDTPFTRQELMQALEGGVRARQRYQANIATNDLLMRDMSKLAIEDPLGYRLVTQRLNDLAGIQGPLGQIQNQVVDKILAPMLGQNSASKIAQIANSTMWHLQLGAGKLSYPIVNALTFLQTVVPEVAYVTSAAPEGLAGKYTYFASGGTKGPVGSVGALDPLRMMKDSVKEMRSPGKGLVDALERATNERVIDPRLVEEYIGESATKLVDWRAAIKSPGGFANWLKAASEWLPAQSERMSRAHAFTVGHMLARDYLRIADPDSAYRFARQFTENTMYLYTAADRPRIFTTPAGSMFGLFKNWMANYTGSMLEYMGEGVMRNNWSPALWQTAGTFVVGGAAATPLYLVADGFSRAFTGEGLLEQTYDAFDGNEKAADGIMYGLPALLSDGHISLYSQTSSPMSNPVRDASMLFSTAHLDRLQYFGKAMGGAWDYWQATGEHPGTNPQFLQQLARAVAPTTLYRIIGAAKEGAINSLSSGYPIMQDVGLMDRLFYMAGFNSLEMDKAYSVANALFAKKEAHRAEVARMGEAYAEYQMAKDSNGMLFILKSAYAAGVDPSSVLKSAQARVAKMTSPMLERNFKREDLARYLNVLGGPD